MLATQGMNPYNLIDFSNISQISSESDIIPYLRNLLSNIKDIQTFRGELNVIQGGY